MEQELREELKGTIRQALDIITECLPESSPKHRNAISAYGRVNTLIDGTLFADSESKSRVLGLVGDTIELLKERGDLDFVVDDLEDIAVGSAATVNGVDYEVARVKVISKAALAKQAPRLFGQGGPHRLVVVTCEGYDPATGHYDSNVVLTATPVA